MSVVGAVSVTKAGGPPAGHFGARGQAWLLAALMPLVFLSGASGLVYQVLWVRILSLTFGVTTIAVTTVLAGFMAGLALGSAAAGRVADWARQPLAVYGLVELGIGLLGYLSPEAFAALRQVHAWLPATGDLEQGPGLVAALVPLGLAFLIVMVPSTLMGATLPVVVKSSLLRSHQLHRDVGLLYGGNTAGAIAGTLAAGFVLIGGYGLQATASAAAAGNLLAGVTALALAGLVRPRPLPDDAGGPPDPAPRGAEEHADRGAVSPRVVAWVYGLSGFCALAYEVVWTRLLALFFDGTTYPFTIMLATVLAGIAAGSCAISPLLSRWRNWGLGLALLEMALGLSAVAGLWAFGRLHGLATWADAVAAGSPLGAPDRAALVVSLATIFPTALLMGAAFPVAARLYTTRAAHAGSQVGAIYAANVCGAILGSYAAGFVLIPQLGAQNSVVALASLNLLLGLALLAALHRPLGRVRATLALAGAGALALAAIQAPDLRTHLLPGGAPASTLVWYGEDAEATVSVLDVPGHGRVMYVNSRPQTYDEPDPLRVQRLLGHLPMLLHPAPRDVLVVGLGGGATAGAVAAHPGARVDVVELVPDVLRAARLFDHVNGRVLDRPNVRWIVDDGRNYLLRAVQAGRRYDVITADLIRPHYAGAANLYSAEYYHLAAQALREDGVMAQWFELSPSHQHQLLIRTFLQAFPHAVLLWNGDLVVGSKRPLAFDEATLARRLVRARPAREELAAAGIRRTRDLLEWWRAGTSELYGYVGTGPVLTDDRPVTEYFRSLPTEP